MRRLLLIGAGGHARVVLDAARTLDDIEVVGLVQPGSDHKPVDGAQVVGSDEDLVALRLAGATHGVVCVAGLKPSPLRAQLFERMRAAGLEGAVIIHRDATVSPRATVGEGSVVFARAVLNPGTRVGRNAIINTAALIEHDCEIGDHAHVFPGAVVGGAARIGQEAYVGIGATVLRGVRIGARSLVEPGSVVTEDVPDDTHVTGFPARTVAM